MAESASPQPLYAVSIQEATRSGDQARMREMEQQAQQHLEEVTSALDQLRSAIGGKNS